MTIRALSPVVFLHCFLDICWLRLDFETFTNQGPAVTTEANGNVACTDTFTVTTSTGGTTYPVI